MHFLLVSNSTTDTIFRFMSKRAKANAAIEQAVIAGKAAAVANKKVDQMVSEIDQLREHHRATPEFTLLHQLAELKGQLADSERRIEVLKAEKNQVSTEKEQFRSSVHKLVRLQVYVL